MAQTAMDAVRAIHVTLIEEAACLHYGSDRLRPHEVVDQYWGVSGTLTAYEIDGCVKLHAKSDDNIGERARHFLDKNVFMRVTACEPALAVGLVNYLNRSNPGSETGSGNMSNPTGCYRQS